MICEWGKKTTKNIKLNIVWEELLQVKIKEHLHEVLLILVNIRAVTGEGSRA